MVDGRKEVYIYQEVAGGVGEKLLISFLSYSCFRVRIGRGIKEGVIISDGTLRW